VTAEEMRFGGIRLKILLCLFLLCRVLVADDAESALRRHDADTAIHLLEDVVRKEPSNAHAYRLLGLAYSLKDNVEKAAENFDRACSLNPNEPNACYFLGLAYYHLDRFDDSLRTMQGTLRSGASDKALTLLGIAEAYEALGRTNDAEESYRQAAGTGNLQARIAYGMFLFHQGRAQESIKILKEANAKAELDRVSRSLAATPTPRTALPHPSEIRFEPTTLPMIVRNGATGEKHQVETMIAGVAVFDYDNDGWPDIFVANGARLPDLVKADPSFQNRLFHNNHDGTFTDVTAQAGLAGVGYSMGVAAADYDNDGWTDLFVTGVNTARLYHNNGDGTFEDVTKEAGIDEDGFWTVAAGWFDYDNDGLLDLFVVRYVKWSPEKDPFCGSERPGYRAYCHPRYYAPLPNSLYHNEGNGHFRNVSGESGIAKYLGKGMGVAFGDYDDDGFLDVFVANDSVPNFLFHNAGNGTFSEVAADAGVAYSENGNAASSMGVDFRDFDNDGREDLFVTALTNERFSLFRNLGRGQFADITGPSRISNESLPWSGWSTGIFDFNNDGYKDLFVAGGHVIDNAELISSRKSKQPNLVFENRGDGTFQLQTLPGEALHRGAAFGDLDRDGRMDVVVTRLNESPLVLHNISPNAGHWLELKLQGHRSNRDGIGAMIHITTAAVEQWNRVTTSVGYGCSSDRTVHFGLGEATSVSALEIRWPSGILQTLHDVPADRILLIEEPMQVPEAIARPPSR